MPKPDDPSNKNKDQKTVGSGDPPEMGKGETLLTGEKGDVGLEPPEIGQGDEQLSPESTEYIKTKGFKSVDELVKSAQNSEKKITELRQADQLKGDLGIPPPMAPTSQPPVTQEPEAEVEIPDDIYSIISDQDKAKTFFRDFAKKVEARTTKKITAGYQQLKTTEMKQEMYNKYTEDPQKFQRLRPIMTELARQHPHANLNQLMGAAEKVEVQRKELFAEEAKRAVGLEGIDLDKLKVLADKAQTTTPLSTGGGGGQVGLSQGKRTEAEKKGDALWKDILAADTLKA